MEKKGSLGAGLERSKPRCKKGRERERDRDVSKRKCAKCSKEEKNERCHTGKGAVLISDHLDFFFFSVLETNPVYSH